MINNNLFFLFFLLHIVHNGLISPKSDVIRINIEKETGLFYLETETYDHIPKISLFSIFYSENSLINPLPSDASNIFILSLASFKMSIESNKDNMIQTLANYSIFDNVINVYQNKSFLVCLNEKGGYMRFIEKIPLDDNLIIFPLQELRKTYFIKGNSLKFGNYDIILGPKIFIDIFMKGFAVSINLYDILLNKLKDFGEVMITNNRCLNKNNISNKSNVFIEILLDENKKIDITDIWYDQDNFTCLNIEKLAHIQDNQIIVNSNFLKNKLLYFNTTNASLHLSTNFDCKIMNIPKINADLRTTKQISESSIIGLIVAILIAFLLLVSIFTYAIVKNKRINTDVVPNPKIDVKTEMSEWESIKRNPDSRRESQEGLIVGTLISPISDFTEKTLENS